MRNKGYILTWDALLALMVVLLTFVTLLALGYLSFSPEGGSSFERLHFLGEDTLDILNKNGILEEIVFYWSQNDNESATQLADSYLDNNLSLIPPQFGYRLEINNENISERILETMESEITARTNVVRFVSGFGINKTPNVWVARAWLWHNDTTLGKIYSLESVWYGNSSRIASGANWTIDHLGGTLEDICIPTDCSGDDKHNYKTDDHSPPNNDDAVDDAIYQLLNRLDTDTPNDGEIDLNFDSENMVFKSSSVATKQLDSQLVEVKLILWV